MPDANQQLFVRGTTVDPARRFAERYKGTPEWDAFVDELPDNQRKLLAEPIQRRRWYLLTDYASMIEVGARHLAPGDPDEFLRDLGRFVFDDGVNTLYRAFFIIASPSFVIKGSSLLWGMFFKGNKLRVLKRSRKSVKAALVDSEFCSRPLCVSIGGGMDSALGHGGAKNIRLDHHRCRSEGGHRCEFHFSWD